MPSKHVLTTSKEELFLPVPEENLLEGGGNSYPYGTPENIAMLKPLWNRITTPCESHAASLTFQRVNLNLKFYMLDVSE